MTGLEFENIVENVIFLKIFYVIINTIFSEDLS
jgi:hypothetical protein